MIPVAHQAAHVVLNQNHYQEAVQEVEIVRGTDTGHLLEQSLTAAYAAVATTLVSNAT